MRKDIEALWKLAEPYVGDAGFDLVEVQSGREVGGWIVRLFIDRAASESTDQASPGVSLEDCERVSRDVSAALDVADLVPHAFALEVSSPGLDRPLRREADFARFAGSIVKIRMQDGVSGRRNFSGVLQGVRNGTVAIDCDGQIHHLPIPDIGKANLVPDWDKEFKRSAS